jgi:hypothetical protein
MIARDLRLVTSAQYRTVIPRPRSYAALTVYYHNSQDIHTCNSVNYCYVYTKENAADILTKAFTKDKHMKLTNAIGLWYYKSWVEMKIELELFHAVVCL